VIKKFGRYYWLDFWCGKKRIRRSLKTTEHGLAIAKANDLVRKYRADAKISTANLRDFAARYLEWARETKPASWPAERLRLDKMLELFDELKVKNLDEVTAYHIEQIRAMLKTRTIIKGKESRNVDRSKTTLNRYLQILRGMFYRAIDWEIIPGPNPLRKVKFAREGAKIQPLTEEQIKIIIAEATAISKKPESPIQKVLSDLLTLILNTGLRRSEALNLKCEDIGDAEARVLGKGAKVRTIPLNAVALAIINRQPRSGRYVFDVPNRSSGSLLRRTMDKISKRAGVRTGLHLFRHAFATRLLAAGVDIVTISEILGHGRMMISLLYSHSDPARKRHAVDSLIP
jgi:integrase